MIVSQFIRYLVFGAAATAVQYGVLAVLVELVRARPLHASIAAYLCGAVASYVLSRTFIFASRGAFGRGLAKFMVFNLIGLALNTAIVGTLIHNPWRWHYLAAQIGATMVVLLYNFATARWIVFKADPAPDLRD